jgi:hypothetical protein
LLADKIIVDAAHRRIRLRSFKADPSRFSARGEILVVTGYRFHLFGKRLVNK